MKPESPSRHAAYPVTSEKQDQSTKNRPTGGNRFEVRIVVRFRRQVGHALSPVMRDFSPRAGDRRGA
jgi:hypothetical protein